MDRAELKALIRQVLQEIEQERAEVDYLFEEVRERRAERESKRRADEELEHVRLENRVDELERQNWGKRT